MASSSSRRAGRTRANASAKPVHPAFDRDDQFQKRREALVRIAIHFFNRRGFHATSMEAIAAEVGLTKGTLYHYYDSKTALAYECMLASIEDGLQMAQKADEGGGSGLQKLERYLHLQFETLAGRGGSSWLHAEMSVLDETQQAEARRRSREVDARVQKFIEEGVGDGSIVAVDPKVAEFFLMGALNWLPRWYSPDGPMSSVDLAALFIRMMFDGLRARAAG
ncbi:MAG: TetR family transcriptional regulator [Panacagrimonas sp.]|nr:TetR/AcrR family transcriptional regulator [Panacagrimonas sp.]MCC2657728.1 TetR family transcriptional regulator [Panacagrimonas sp.]